MRKLLALLASFTLSTSTVMTAVACGTADQTTVVIFDWNSVINSEHNRTADDMYQYLLDNTDTAIGQSLYKDIVDYISLSILKTNSTFTDDYQFAKQSIENEITNTQNSLRAKYGRKWETQWQNFLKEPAQGGDGNTGSYQRYFDVLLKTKANAIVSQYYVGDNYHNYQYYNSTEITIWLNDMYDKIHNQNWTMTQYASQGIYKDKVWIVTSSFNNTSDSSDLETEIKNAETVSNIPLEFKVAKTKDDKSDDSGENYLIDPSNTIKGLLSNQQTKIAQVWMKNQGPIWTRQIVVPFRDEVKNRALKDKIELSNFNETELKRVITNINNPILGFDGALRAQTSEIKSISSSVESGDLGLVTLSSDSASIKPSFSYYLYRYVTSAQGIGNRSDTTLSYNLPQYDSTTVDLNALITSLDRTSVTPSDTHTSSYNDLMWMKDSDTNPRYSGADGNQIAIFIDGDGIHFVQTPGINYTSTVTTSSLPKIITDYTQLLSDPQKRENASWSDVASLVDRPGGLTNTPYLDFLQTQYLLWNTKNLTSYFDLNASLSKFTNGSSDISSEIWWDYILYFNNNINNIHWNTELSTLLSSDINSSDTRIYSFIKSMKTWFLTTFQRRWNLQQGIVSTDNLIKNIRDLNDTWDSPDYENGPVARLNPDDIKIYLNNVAAQIIWYYDPNSIQN